MNLNNSPPYILDILPDIHIHIRLIITHHRQQFDQLNEIDYFQETIIFDFFAIFISGILPINITSQDIYHEFDRKMQVYDQDSEEQKPYGS